VLLVLDNMEHLLGPDGTPPPLILDILQNTQGVQLLVTSRERVNVEVEYVLALGGLQVPPTDTDPGATNASSVQLFMSRAARAAPAVRIPIDDLRAVIRVCRLLEGMPLGIELAAHWVAHFTVTEIADAIETNLGFLTTTDRALPDRHRSLHAVFSYSWGLLPRAEQQALTRLSVFHGGFSREAAQKVAVTSVMCWLRWSTSRWCVRPR
jgi:predicted ATPase